MHVAPRREEGGGRWRLTGMTPPNQTPQRVLLNQRRDLLHPTSSKDHITTQNKMSRPGSSMSRPLTLTEELERLEQSITLTLQGLASTMIAGELSIRLY